MSVSGYESERERERGREKERQRARGERERGRGRGRDGEVEREIERDSDTDRQITGTFLCTDYRYIFMYRLQVHFSGFLGPSAGSGRAASSGPIWPFITRMAVRTLDAARRRLAPAPAGRAARGFTAMCSAGRLRGRQPSFRGFQSWDHPPIPRLSKCAAALSATVPPRPMAYRTGNR